MTEPAPLLPGRRHMTHWLISTVLPATSFVLALIAIWLWYSETREEPLDRIGVVTHDGDRVVLTQAEHTLARAEEAVNSAELILSFLEGASVIITISIAAAAVVGLSTINELRETMNDTVQELLKRVEEAENRLREREKELENIEDLLDVAKAQIDQVIEDRLAQVYHDTESARKQSAALARHAMAEQLLREKNFDAALHACEEAYALDPQNYANNYLYGTLLIDKGDFDGAIDKLSEALEADGDFVPAIAALGLANRRAGDLADDRRRRNELYNLAEARLLDAIGKNPALLTPDGESYYGTLGSLYRRQGRIEDALDSYRRAAEVTPQRSYPYINLAMLYLHQQEDQLRDQNLIIAERNAARRLADTPTDYWAMYDLGLIYLMREETEAAVRHFKEGIEVTPAAVSVYYSVIARLDFLQSFVPQLPGLETSIDLLETQIKRYSTR